MILLSGCFTTQSSADGQLIKERGTAEAILAGDGIAGLAGTPDLSLVAAVTATSVAMTLALVGIRARITCPLVQHRAPKG
jgi:hypothetical protein